MTGRAYVEIGRTLFLFAIPLAIAPLLVWLERRVCAWIQGRVGPNRVGPLGLLQPLADVIKLIFKEDIRPAQADRFMYNLAPFLAFFPAMIVFGLLPVAKPVDLGVGEPVRMQAYDFGLGVVVFLALVGIAVYGVAFGAWASNNKYSLLGGVRAAAQMLSYELVLTLSVVWVILACGTASLHEIVLKQTGGVLSWNLFRYPPMGILAAGLFFAAALAENKRLPFDLPEGEAELVGGYHTEYSSMRFGMFFMGEYVAVFATAGLVVTLFLGGWHVPGLDAASAGLASGVLSFAVFLGKTMLVVFVVMWIRWTFPRLRWDIVMRVSWNRLVPLAFCNLVFTGVYWYLAG